MLYEVITGVPSVFTKFKIMGLPKSGGESQFDFRFFDSDGNQTISRNDEYIDILTRNSAGTRLPVWRVTVDTVNGPKYENSIFPSEGDA